MTRTTLGIIESLSLGFQALTKRLWLLIIPMGLDLFLWLMPQVSARPLVERIAGLLTAPPEGGADFEQLAQNSREALQALGDWFNFLGLLASGLARMPSIGFLLPSGGDVGVGTFGAAFLLWVLLTLVGIYIGSVYLAFIVLSLRQPEPTQEAGSATTTTRVAIPRLHVALSLAGRIWVRLTVYGLILIGLVVAFVLPVSVGLGFLALVSQALAAALSGLAALLATWLTIWLMIALYFTVDAIALQGATPLQAMWRSLNVVRFNLWSALGLIILIQVLGLGFSLIWQFLTNNPIGALLAIAGNAYLGTGLVIAALLFYQDRHRHWQGEREAQNVMRKT